MIDRLRYQGAFLPVLTVVASLIVIWYAGAVFLNSTQLIDRYQRQDINWNLGRLAADAWRMERPVLPSPHQVGIELKKTVLDKRVTSKRSLVYHAGITLSSSLLGFVLGTLLGVALAIGIVYVTTLDRSLMPWIIASQTVPILALAPMIIVVLGSVGVTGSQRVFTEAGPVVSIWRSLEQLQLNSNKLTELPALETALENALRTLRAPTDPVADAPSSSDEAPVLLPAPAPWRSWRGTSAVKRCPCGTPTGTVTVCLRP